MNIIRVINVDKITKFNTVQLDIEAGISPYFLF